MNKKIDKKTGKIIREYEVNGNQKLTLPLLSLHQLEIATDEDAEQFVKEIIHDEGTLGFPLFSMYKKYGIMFQAIDATSAHVLLIINGKLSLETLAIFNHIYNRIGYNLIFDNMTVFRPRYNDEVYETSGETTEEISSQAKEVNKVSSEGLSQETKSKQLKIDVFGMEVA
tara:strand:- start:156 stop:665 length:510 start_codon:yes stop_codon:yes gene_type:complete